MKTNIGLPDKTRAQIAIILAKLLADEYLLSVKTRNAHWNVEGPDFHAMHAFFEQQYEQLEESIDDIAERIRAIGHGAPGSLSLMLKHTRLKELDKHLVTSAEFIAVLLADHEQIIRQLRQDAPKCAELGDDGTNDFLVGLMADHEKMAWMLRAALS